MWRTAQFCSFGETARASDPLGALGYCALCPVPWPQSTLFGQGRKGFSVLSLHQHLLLPLTLAFTHGTWPCPPPLLNFSGWGGRKYPTSPSGFCEGGHVLGSGSMIPLFPWLLFTGTVGESGHSVQLDPHQELGVSLHQLLGSPPRRPRSAPASVTPGASIQIGISPNDFWEKSILRCVQ